MATDNSSKAYKEALKQIENMVNKQEALKKSTKDLESSWNAVASEIFKMDGAQFFKNVEKSPEQLRAMGKEVQQLEEGFRNLGDNFNKTLGDNKKFQYVKKSLQGIGEEFKNSSNKINSSIKSSFNEIYQGLDEDLKKIIKSESDLEKILKNKDKLTDNQKDKLKGFEKFQTLEKKHQELNEEYQKKILDKLNLFKKNNEEISTMNQEMVDKVIERLALGEDEVKIAAELGDEGRKVLAALSSSNKELLEMNKGMTGAAEQIKVIQREATEMNKQFSLGKGLIGGLKSMGSGLASIIKKDWIGSMMKFDEVLNDVQKQTGVNMDFNKTKFAELQTEVAQFGMSVEGAGKMIADMSKELNTTNFSVLSQATKDFSSIEGATGAAAGDITTIAGELMRMGESSGQVKEFMQGADTMARKFGVSSAKAMSAIARNISKIRTMGFVGGEKSLGKMVATAERLRMNVDEIFDVAKRARSIEGAMDMAAELQLAGGSFANINPMDLLAAARKGPAELQKILTGMGKDIGHFSKETGKYEFDPVDVDRLQMVADATGQSMDSIQNMIQKNAEDTEKLNPFQGMMDGLDDADKEIANSALSDMIKRDKDGKLTIDADNDMAKKMGINSLEDINSENIEAMLKQKTKDASTLEEQNKRNQSLKQSFDNFINALMSIFSFFQPALEFLTKIMQGVTSIFTTVMGWLPGWSKALLGGLLVFGAMFSTSVGKFITQGVGSFVKTLMNPKKALMGALGGGGDKKATDITGSGAKGPGPGVGVGLKSLAEGLKSMGDKDVFKGIAAVALAGPAFLLFVPALPGLLVMGLIGAMGKAVTQGFDAIAGGLDAFGSKKGVFKGIAAIALAAVPLLLFTIALPGLLAMALIGALGMLVTAGFQAISTGLGIMGSNLANIAKGALALALVALAVGAFAFVASMMGDIDWMNVLAGIGVMALVVIGLIALGFLLSGPGIVFLAIGALALIGVGLALAIAGAGLMVAALAFQQLSSVDWSGFSEMGGALASVVPGLLLFSLAAMMFMNPLTLLGIIFMVGALASLVSVMAPLAESLTIGADSLDRFAAGLEKLSAAADALSLEKLEKLKELSDSMANAGAGGAAMAAMANVAGGGGGAGGDGEVRKIEVNVKMNGRELQNFIVKDTAIIK
jgi:uncharacterized protein YukE